MNNLDQGITRICHLNIHSLKNKVEVFKNFLISNKIGICILSETWLQNSDKFSINNYNIERRDRSNETSNVDRGGGVLIAIHQSIRYHPINIPQSCRDKEIIAVRLEKVSRSGEDIHLVAVYNPPSETICLDDLVALSLGGQKTLLMGDFNAHSPVWLSKTTNASGKEIENFLEQHEFIILNDENATYESTGGSSSIIDLALCSGNLSEDIYSFEVGEFCFSDHNPIFVDLIMREMPKFGKFTKTVKSVNWSKFKAEMERFNHEMTLPETWTTSDLDTTGQCISQMILKSLELSTTTKTIQYDPHSHMTLPPNIVSLIQQKREVRKAFRRTKDPLIKTELNYLDSLIKSKIKHFKQEKWERFCNELNTHQVSDYLLWRKIKSIETSNLPKPRKTPSLNVASKDDLVTNPEDVANVFADSLEAVFQDANDPKFDSRFKTLIENTRTSLFTNNDERPITVTEAEVEDTIKKLRTRGAPGEDGITNACLKQLPPSTYPILVSLFNASINLGHVPACWKNAVVVMIPKPLKNHSDPANFRPISLLNTLSKLLERVVLFRLNIWIGSNRILSPLQSGFRRGRQTQDHIFRLVQDGLTAFNRDQSMGAIFIDIEKAFDRVWHDGLLFKINNLRIPNYLGIWISNYLHNRTFKVRIGSAYSSYKPIKAGVPQGSVLGPVLFNLFFNDISDQIANKVELGKFADDLSAWTAFNNIRIIESRLQNQLTLIEDWMNTWRTKLSTNKTVWTIFKKNNSCTSNLLSLEYNGELIKMDRNPKFLGLTLDPGLTFNKYANIIRERTAKRINILRRIRGKSWGASSKLIMTTYKILIRPIIDYTPFITPLMSVSNYMILERAQRRAMRAITHWPLKTRASVIYEQLDIEDVLTRAWNLTDKYICKALNINELIRTSASTYNVAPELNEGAWCHTKKRTTIFGLLIKQPNLKCSQLIPAVPIPATQQPI